MIINRKKSPAWYVNSKNSYIKENVTMIKQVFVTS